MSQAPVPPAGADGAVPPAVRASVRLGGVLRGAHITLLGSAVGGALAIVNEVLCARHLGVGSYGVYAFALIIARICEGISTMGLPVAALHHIAILRDQQQPRRVLGMVLASLLPPLVIGCSFAGLLWRLAPWIAHRVFGGDLAVPYLQALALAIPLMGLSEVLGVITRGFGHAAYYVIVRSLVPPLSFLLLLQLIMARDLDPHLVPAAFALAYGLAVLAGLLAVRRVGGAALFRLRPQFGWRALYGYAAPVLANHLMYLVVATTPILMLGVLESDHSVGIFRACMQLVIPFDMMVIAFNAAAGQHYAVLEKRKQHAELALLVERITGYMAPPAMAWLLVLAVNRLDLMRLMGPDFVAGAPILMVLALAQATLCCVGTAGYLLVMSGRQRYETFNAALTAAVGVLLNYWLIGQAGALGAAAATLAACLLISALRLLQVWRLTGIRVLRRSLLRVLALAGVTAAGMALLLHFWPGLQGGLLGILVRNLVLATLFGALYWRFGLSAQIRREVRARLRRQLARPSSAP
jgi:O-antigen/teichoic acid export membrane protein